MRRLAAIACALALGLGATSARADGIVPVEGIWHATTSAGLPVSFEVSGGQVLDPFGYEAGVGRPTAGGHPARRVDAAFGPIRGDEGGFDPRTASLFVFPVAVGVDRGGDDGGFRVGAAAVAPAVPEVPGPPPPPPRTFVVDDVRSGHLVEEPRRMVLAGGRIKIFELDDWFEYGEPRPIGSGRALLRRCAHCRDPEVRRPKAFVFLSRLRERNGHRVYERIRWSFHGPLPRGFARHGSWLLE